MNDRIFAKTGLDTKPMPHNGTDTSKAAAESHTPEAAKTMRARVYHFIAERSSDAQLRHGATCDEAELFLGLPHQSCSARFNELQERGLIWDSGRRRKTRSGRAARVYVTRVK